MTTNEDKQTANARPAEPPGGTSPQDSAALERPVPSFEDVLATLPPEQRELAILASTGC